MSDPVPSAAALMRPCPYCADVCPVFDALLDLLSRHRGNFELSAFLAGGNKMELLRSQTLHLTCTYCRNERQVLTEEGERLVRMLPPNVVAAATRQRDDEIPF